MYTSLKFDSYGVDNNFKTLTISLRDTMSYL